MNRHQFLNQSALLSAGALLAPYLARATGKADPTLLIISGWQDINIGDIAHTPGLIALLKKRLPQARVILWKKTKSEKVQDLLKKHYPDVQIIHGAVDNDFVPQSEEVKQAFQTADFFVHGSGPSLVAEVNVQAWHRQTGKPFGVFGVTLQDITPSQKELLPHASFVFTRETASVERLRQAGVTGPHIAFAPDATFALTIQDREKAAAFMQANGLKPRQFVCAIPRLRYTPYHQLRPNRAGWTDERIKLVEETNAKWKEIDHAKLREALVAWVRKTGQKIVLCPEMTYEVPIMDELLVDPLPADVKAKVVKHDYWMPDEAASLYAQAHSVLSFECHSPIMAIANGTPAFYLRHPEDTIKGQMYYDLGLGDWTFEIERTTGAQITERLMQVTDRYAQAQANVQTALKNVTARYDEVFPVVRRVLNA